MTETHKHKKFTVAAFLTLHDFFLTAIFAEVLLVPLSVITGQLLHVSYFKFTRDLQGNRVCKVFCAMILPFFVATLVLLNAVPAGFVLYGWFSGSINVFNVTFLFNVEKVDDSKIPTIMLRDVSTETMDVHSLNDSTVRDNLNEFEPFAKLVIAFFAVSSALSFLLFMSALICTYKCVWLRQCTMRNNIIEQGEGNEEGEGNEGGGDNEVTPLDSFRFDDKDKTSTKLDLPESAYFCILFLLNIGLLGTCIALFVHWHYNKLSYYPSNISIGAEGTIFGIYMYSLLCTIVSCFIFSKLAYSVTRRCLDLYNKLQIFPADGTQRPADGTQRPADGTPANPSHPGDAILDFLIDEDDKFTEMAQATLNMFEYWFTVHWVCYTVTSFLAIALFFDMLTMYIQSTFIKPVDTAVGFHWKELVVVALFTVQHCFLFLYPCFKAAAVTVGREKLIKKNQCLSKFGT